MQDKSKSLRHVILNKAIMKKFVCFEGHTYRLSLVNNSIEIVSINKLGTINQYYPDEIETKLSSIEGDASKAINLIINSNYTIGLDKPMLYEYYLMMMIRNPNFAKLVIAAFTPSNNAFYEDPNWHQKFVDYFFKSIDIFMKDIKPAKILRNYTNVPFINSCSGISMVSVEGKFLYALVISRDIALLYDQIFSNDNQLSSNIYSVSEEHVHAFNHSIITNESLSYFRIVFSNSKDLLLHYLNQIETNKISV
jgi:hypothetical protein